MQEASKSRVPRRCTGTAPFKPHTPDPEQEQILGPDPVMILRGPGQGSVSHLAILYPCSHDENKNL